MLDNRYFYDESEEVVEHICDHCKGEIYTGDDIFTVNGDIVHEDCLMDYLKDNDIIEKGVAGDE